MKKRQKTKKKPQKRPKAKIQPLGDLHLELEAVVQKIMDQHNIQWSDMIWNLYGYLEAHYPGHRETYLDGTHPVLYYGPMRKEK